MNFLLFVKFLVFLLLAGCISGETELGCSFSTISGSASWPPHKECTITNANLGYVNETFKFIGSSTDIQDTSVVYFKSCTSVVQHVPLEIFEQFHKLNGLMIMRSTIPILKNDLFADSKFEKIQYLDLSGNEIETIEENAFGKIKNLKLINLNWNRLNFIDSNIFQNNPELKNIHLRGNKINSIHPSLFINLKNLKYVEFDAGNICHNHDVGCSTCSPLTSDVINEKFKTCYNNHKATSHLNNEVINSKFELQKQKQTNEELKEQVEVLKKELETNRNASKANFTELQLDGDEKVHKLQKELEEQKKKAEEETKTMKSELEKQKQESNEKIEKLEKELKANFEAAIESIRIQSLATLKVLLVGLNYNEPEAKEIKGDLEKIPEGKTNMKTYQEAIKANFVEREEGMEKKMDGYLEEIVRDV